MINKKECYQTIKNSDYIVMNNNLRYFNIYN